MANEIETYRANSLYHCSRLLSELENNKFDAETFFGGEVYKVYIDTTDKVKNKTKNIRTKIRNI